MPTMIAARVHQYGEPMRLDQIEIPRPRPTDVLVEVKACGIVPNLQRVIANFFATKSPEPRPTLPLPAIFGLDPAGVIAETGEHVRGLKPGERVYVNPVRGCGACRMCRAGAILDCPKFTLQGYFGRSLEIMQDYPYGGLAQFITAPASAIVRLPDNLSFNAAARFGYLGTAYSALKTLNVGPGRTLLINGISGMLGLCGALTALAMGTTTILGTGRNRVLLDRVKAIAPERIDVFSMSDGPGAQADPLVEWAKRATDGDGLDAVLDCLPPDAPGEAMMRPLRTLRRGGHAVNVGAVMDQLPLNAFWLMTNRIGLAGSVWFTTAEGQEMADMTKAGTLDLSVLDHQVSPLSKVNEAIAGMHTRNGGFSNFVVDPSVV
jgi:D-arabinose 1-dehydrogenase-like Zn-dependent alcohol dehydrogenase